LTSEERIARRAAIDEVRAEIGAKPDGAWEPPSDCVMLTSIENRFRGMKGGITMQVGKRQAAEHIVDGSHRLSTDEEIAAHHEDELDRRCAARDAENRAERRTVVYTTPKVSGEADGAEMPNSSATKEQ